MDGTGKKLDPFIIKTETDLISIQNDPYAHYEIAADIELTGQWGPFRFSGSLDGRGHTISNLEVDDTAGNDHYGFFSQLLDYADVRNLNLIMGPNGIKGSGAKYGGALAGFTNGYPTVENVLVIGAIDNGGSRGAGMFGYLNRFGYFRALAVFVTVQDTGSYIYGVVANSNYGDGWAELGGVWSSEYSGKSRSGPLWVGTDLTIAQAADQINYPSYFDFDEYWEIVGGFPRVKKLDPTNNPSTISKVSGVVQINGTPEERTVRAFGYDPTAHTIDGDTINLAKSLGHATSDPTTGEYTIDLLAGYDKRIFVVAFDDYGADFAPDMTVAVGDRIHPTTPNGHVFECTSAGTLPSEEPAWVVDTEAAQLYGTASMIAKPFYRPMVHGPVVPEVTAVP